MAGIYSTFIRQLKENDTDENIIKSIKAIMDTGSEHLRRLLGRPIQTLGTSPLGYVGLGKREAVAIALVETGYTDPNIYIHCGHIGNQPILTAACFYRMENLALALLNRPETDPTLIGSFSITALMIAVRNNLMDVVYYLLLRGDCRISHPDYMGRNALYFANINENERVLTALLETGEFDPEHVDATGITAFMDCLIGSRDSDWIPLLYMDYGMETPRNKTAEGLTPLIVACNQNRVNVARRILHTGASLPGHVENDGYTALMLCCTHSTPEMLDLATEIFDTGASNPTHVNHYGQSAMSLILEAAGIESLITPSWSPANSDIFSKLLKYYLEDAPADEHFTTACIPMMCSKPIIREEILKLVARSRGLDFDVPETCLPTIETFAIYGNAEKAVRMRTIRHRPSRIRSLSDVSVSPPPKSRSTRRVKSASPYRGKTRRNRESGKKKKSNSNPLFIRSTASVQPFLAHAWGEDDPEYYVGTDGLLHIVPQAVSDNNVVGERINKTAMGGAKTKIHRINYRKQYKE